MQKWLVLQKSVLVHNTGIKIKQFQLTKEFVSRLEVSLTL